MSLMRGWIRRRKMRGSLVGVETLNRGTDGMDTC